MAAYVRPIEEELRLGRQAGTISRPAAENATLRASQTLPAWRSAPVAVVMEGR